MRESEKRTPQPKIFSFMCAEEGRHEDVRWLLGEFAGFKLSPQDHTQVNAVVPGEKGKFRVLKGLQVDGFCTEGDVEKIVELLSQNKIEGYLTVVDPELIRKNPYRS